ncbi:MAG: hypothetical protein FJ109_16315 [Deltaproteobacteria bacterium]|nr:hypothetical protein [Deltaproteobacteria bacterium]
MKRNVVLASVCAALLVCVLGSGSARGASCCVPSPLPICDDPNILLCVCLFDMDCCMFAWDAICVAEVTALGCGSCGGCEPNCNGKTCGDNGCGGVCGQCAFNQVCQNGWCVGSCTPNCGGKQCGDDGCGGSCGFCQNNFSCVNGVCQPNCQPNCSGKQCGADGCGGQCGTCNFGEFCTAAGVCQPECTKMCGGKQCGDDGCGGKCGSCGFGMQCDPAGQCVPECKKQCQGKDCGDDGCGALCGQCIPGWECVAGVCQEECKPSCVNKECGPNGCGGQCGSCGFGQLCTVEGFCVDEDEADGYQVLLPDGGTSGEGDAWDGDVGGNGSGSGPTSCPQGQLLRYGKCILDPTYGEDSGGDKGGGCSVRGPCGSTMSLLLLLVAAAWLVGSRWNGGRRTRRIPCQPLRRSS